ncbi:9-o-acetyl-n-acetylneuraminate esterase [Gigaspora margarita]|uniref:9-o-acetyl-n-acetylneuraminate esterase n=1 Tax=Gigaspora margarita TaxID=4874 RepID=A0A8H3XDW5_GIGMA|nr:9-o-acetyl-n-acetylneuraminate esterase [Gigaspora margarita]
MRTIEHKQMPPKNSVDKKRRINQGRLYVLLGFVIPIPGQENYMLVEKQDKVFYSPYTFHTVNIPANISEKINEMIVKLVNRENLYIPETCYLVNTLSGECTCYDYIWNGPFRDVCKHVYAARQYTEALRGKLQMQEIKEKLVQHFKDKENVVAPEKKNYIIHRGTSDEVYQEILRLYYSIDNDIFFPIERKTIANDPFHPMDSIQIPSTSGAPKNNRAKFRKPSHFSSNMQIENSQECYNENFSDSTITEITEISEIPISDIENVDPHSIRRRNTTRVRNKRRTHSQAIHSNRQENDTAFTTKRSLEELFLEKKCDWNPREFTNMAVTKRLRLDDDPVENGIKLYRWISNRKAREKNLKDN